MIPVGAMLFRYIAAAFCIGVGVSASEVGPGRRLRGTAKPDVVPEASISTQSAGQKNDNAEVAALWDDVLGNPTMSHSFAAWLGDLDAETRDAWERNVSNLSLAQGGAAWFPHWHPHPWHHGWHHWHHWGPGPHWHHWYLSEEELSNTSESSVDESLAQGAWWGPHWHPRPWYHGWHHGWHHWHPGWYHWHHWYASNETLGNASSADFAKSDGPAGEVDAGEVLNNTAFWNTVFGDATLVQGFAAWVGYMDNATRSDWESSLFQPIEASSDDASNLASEMSSVQAAAEWWGPHWHPHPWHDGWHHGWHHWGHGPHWHHWYSSETTAPEAPNTVNVAP